jgi:glutathione-independent formaldehyde dehydrogenase
MGMTVEAPHAVILKIFSTNICGSDQHMVRGRTTAPVGQTLGHEITGEVIEKGNDVQFIDIGDLCSVPFNIACGRCRNCKERKTGVCLNVNPARAGSAYGYVDMGGWVGGQAEYVTVPFADFNLLKFPDKEQAKEKILDLTMLSYIFPTGYHATEMAEVGPGDSVVVYGSGPVGLMAAYSAIIRGAGKVMVVDRHPDRLRLAEEIGAIPIDDSKGSPVDAVLNETDGVGADKGCECVGYQAHDPDGNEDPAMTMNNLVNSVKFTGRIGCVGVFVPQDPGGPDQMAQQGKAAFDFGMFWFKGQQLGVGQAPVKRYNRHLRELVHLGKAKPSWIVSHDLSLEEGPGAYEHFDKREDGWTKVVLHPNGS